MMKSIILSIGLISTINASRLLQSTCAAANEVFSPCNGHCRPTCATGPNIICTLQCEAGCVCDEGYILDEEDGTCIPEGDCPTQCGSFEEYTDCGSACPAVCGESGPDNCIQVCVAGCFCQDGYIRDSNGRCISNTECLQSQCDANANEVFSPCNGHCRPTCATGPNIICTRQCEPGCNCADGYILDQEDGVCIPEGDCPAETNECPLRCETGFNDCNTCFCDGLGGPGGCTKIGCPPPSLGSGCSKCEVGYTLNAANECESAKVSCTSNSDCSGSFKCKTDPEWRAYSDLEQADVGDVCIKIRKNQVCTSDADCNTANGFGCLMGDQNAGNGRCVSYQ